MAKMAPDAMINSSLQYVSACLSMTVCSSSPTTWAEATATFCLATQVMSAADFALADDASGRKLTMSSKTGLTIASTGVADHIALTLAAGSTLRYLTTCTAQSLTSGGTVDVPAWKINIADPT
jgi:hypothetical protein